METWRNFVVNENISAKELGEILVNKFASWIGTSSEVLLEDGGHVIDHLSDDYSRDDFNGIPEERWAMAWEYFYKETKC